MPVIRNGWRLLEYPALTESLDRLADSVRRLRAADPVGYVHHPNAKLLGRLLTIMLVEVPADPNRADYRLKGPLSPWRRVATGRWRLFFRFDSGSRIIAYCWLNGADGLRKDGDAGDPYAVFGRMVARGTPPEDWPALLRACRDAAREG
ncbi:type II toxin-antitoxin system YhaV family toxin [Rhodocista pekingensis]|uniref:Type II toxin-antitoxin system YhaV family toxin n=1 Tax=Rhodocista pekingensis TaxID=201185 RepID=A0ABW2KTU1_9PROT